LKSSSVQAQIVRKRTGVREDFIGEGSGVAPERRIRVGVGVEAAVFGGEFGE